MKNTLIPSWNSLFSELSSFSDWPESVFGQWKSSLYSSARHPIDISEDKEHIIIEVPLAGYPKEHVEVSLDNSKVLIKASFGLKPENDSKNKLIERVRKSEVNLSVDLFDLIATSGEENTPQASMTDGMLKIVLNKKHKENKTSAQKVLIK